MYLIFVTTRALLRFLRRGVARMFLRRREIEEFFFLRRVLRTFRSRPLLSRARPLSEFRFRLRRAIVFLRGFAPIKARCGFLRRVFRLTVFFLFAECFVNIPATLSATFDAMEPATASVRMF